MPNLIDKKTLEYLAELARIEIEPEKEEKMIKDLGNILNHFKELQDLDTSKVEPMAGGTNLKNITREDILNEELRGKGTESFPDSKNGYLKVPPVFE